MGFHLVESFVVSWAENKKPPGSPAASQQTVAGMSHHVIRGRLRVFGTSSPAAETGASKSPGVPLGFVIRCFMAASFSRRPKNGGPGAKRQGN
jgi:hypothetical protein